MNQNPIRERLDSFIRQKGYSRRSVEQLCGFKPTYLATLSGEIPGNKLDKIQHLFPDLNIEWLKTGDGAMCLDNSYLINRIYSDNRGVEIMNRIGEFFAIMGISSDEFERSHNIPKGSFVESLAQGKPYMAMGWASLVLDEFPKLSAEWILRGDGFMFMPKHIIPQTDGDENTNDIELFIGTDDKLDFDEAEILIRMPEHDMSPKIKFGDYLLCKKMYDRYDVNNESPTKRRLAWKSYSTYFVSFEYSYTVKDVVVTEKGDLNFYRISPDGERELSFSTNIMDPEIDCAYIVLGLLRKGLE